MSRVNSRNPIEKQEYDRAYYKAHRETILVRSRAYHEAHREAKNKAQRRYYSLKGKWNKVPGWSYPRFLLNLMEQSGHCGICRNKMGPPVRDHDHKTGCARGLLCHSCNRMLGDARDNPAILKSGILYLENHRKRRKSKYE